MINRKEKNNLIKERLFKIKKNSERLCEQIHYNIEVLNKLSENTLLSTLLEEIEFGYEIIAHPNSISEEIKKSKKQWNLYLENNDIGALTLNDVCNIAYIYECFNSQKYWDILDNFLSEKLVFILVRNFHSYWTDLDDFENKSEKFKNLLNKVNSSKKIIQIWRKNPQYIIDKHPKNLVAYFLNLIKNDPNKITELYNQKIYDLQKTDVLACLIHGRCLQEFSLLKIDSVEYFEKFLDLVNTFIKNTNEIILDQYDSTRPVSKSLKICRKEIISELIRKVSKMNSNSAHLFRDRVIVFLIQNYGDPRDSEPKNDIDDDAIKIFKGWLYEKDIKFFFDNLVDDNNDKHDRKGFWLNYADKIDDVIFIFSKKTTAYSKNSNRILKLYCDKRINNKKMFELPKLTNNIFIIKIKNLVFIEFSDVGACYIYKYEDFCNKKIKSVLITRNDRENAKESDFKHKDIAVGIIKHNKSINDDIDWQNKISKYI